MKKIIFLVSLLFINSSVIAGTPFLAGVYQKTNTKDAYRGTQEKTEKNSVNAANYADVSKPTTVHVQDFDGKKVYLTQKNTKDNSVNTLNYYRTSNPSKGVYQSVEAETLETKQDSTYGNSVQSANYYTDHKPN